MDIVRNLHFAWSEWDRDAKIMLAFNDPELGQMLEDQGSSLAWKVFHISKGQYQATTVTYTNKLAFGSCTFNNGNIAAVSTWTGKGMDLGDTVELLKNKDSEGGPIFGTTQNNPRMSPKISCTNKTKSKRNISVGFINGRRYEPTFAWKDVGDELSVAAKFHPVLRLYMTSDFKQGQLLTGAIEALKPFAEIDLAELSESTYYWIEQEPGTKKIVLTEE